MKLILIVDDEYDIVSSLEMILNLEGYDVRSAFNGKEALELLGKHERLPDLILSDLMMPVMDGYEFVRALAANPKYRAIPVLLMSAGQLNEGRLNKCTYRAFVRKPFDLDRMVRLIETNGSAGTGDQS